MKTQYTKKQISESISHWKKVLEALDKDLSAIEKKVMSKKGDSEFVDGVLNDIIDAVNAKQVAFNDALLAVQYLTYIFPDEVGENFQVSIGNREVPLAVISGTKTFQSQAGEMNEGLKNKILSWFGAKSSWTELEDVMDKFFEKLSKNSERANSDTFMFKSIAKEIMKEKDVKECISKVISKASGTASDSLNNYFEEIRDNVLWAVMRKVGKDHMRKNKCRYEAAVRMITKRILTEISSKFSESGKRAYSKYAAEMERQRKEEEERQKAWLKANYKPGFQSKYDNLARAVASDGIAALG